MPLSWNEIKSRAIAFAKEWEHETSEDAEAKSFWDDFFNVFGISRRRVATFEEAVKKADNKQGFIDLLWKGHLLVEHKSRGKDLDAAFQQALNYCDGLKEHELPKYVLVSDFQRFRLRELATRADTEFELRNFVDQVHLFGFIAGYEKRKYKEEDAVNIKAAELMGRLHDRLEEIGYTGHALELYLVRLLFCLFADDTGIFDDRGIFYEYLDLHTKPDGSDLAMHLGTIFHTLNTPQEQRLKNLDESLAAFPYVNGKLFEENLPPAAFDSQMREMLLEACGLDWGSISPAIFGSMFQAVMNPKERRNLGAHYTSEKNIQKVIKPLFLDDLHKEFERAKGNRNKLNELHQKIAGLHFLDPACGCGNFLIISYRELRELEILILRELNKSGQGFLDVREIIRVDVDQFAGIEIDEFAVRIAETAMWLIDHQMNQRVSEEFGQYFVRLPLTKAAKIVHGNALRLDWSEVVPKEQLSFILGNPPFIGTSYQTAEQKEDMAFVFKGVKSFGMLDFVAAWYVKAGFLIQDTDIKCAFVSTNSIAQGEQVGILWGELYNRYHLKIHFAHRTFSWSNEARGNAAVHVVIIGFAAKDADNKRIYEYASLRSEPQERRAKNINPYLVEGSDIYLQSISKPVCNVPKMQSGSAARDGGHLILSKAEKEELCLKYPDSTHLFKRFISGDDFINNVERWCIWLKSIAPNDFRHIPEFQEKFKQVRSFRENSTRSGTKKMADFSYLFAEERQPQKDFVLIPKVSSENRKYIPIAHLTKDFIISDKTFVVPDASPFLFGVLTSLMHMTWMRYTCGRLKSDYSYSNTIVYNNYPFPQSPTDAQKQKVEAAAQAVLDARANYPGSSLADLYDPVTMPPDLVKAHQALDKAVDLCYRPQAFTNELSRIEFLFGLYEQYSAPMFGNRKSK